MGQSDSILPDWVGVFHPDSDYRGLDGDRLAHAYIRPILKIY